MEKIIQLAFTAALAVVANTAMASMILSFESSDRSWVGQGESHTVTPSDGYIFSGGELRSDNSLRFLVASLNSPFGPDWNASSADPYNYWTLALSAPFDQLLDVGYYGNTARYPFQNANQPGLNFSGNHRENNTNSGFFEILEISFDALGDIESLAVDFTQYGETSQDRWINGRLRFNSTIPLASAPSTLPIFLVLMGFIAALGSTGKKSAHKSFRQDRGFAPYA